jgi:hypothetical protein
MFKIMEFARMMVDTKAPRISTIQHADVRRSLLRQKAYALYLYAAAHQDPVSAKIVSGAAQLLPIVKAVGSERSYQRLTESLQTLGGSGYLQDYRSSSSPGLRLIANPIATHGFHPLALMAQPENAGSPAACQLTRGSTVRTRSTNTSNASMKSRKNSSVPLSVTSPASVIKPGVNWM